MPKDLMVAAGTYFSKKDNAKKTRWVSIGVMMENDNGPYLLLEPHINIAAFKEEGKDRVIVSVFEQKEHANRDMNGRVQAKPKAPTQLSQDEAFDDEIPF